MVCEWVETRGAANLLSPPRRGKPSLIVVVPHAPVAPDVHLGRVDVGAVREVPLPTVRIRGDRTVVTVAPEVHVADDAPMILEDDDGGGDALDRLTAGRGDDAVVVAARLDDERGVDVVNGRQHD